MAVTVNHVRSSSRLRRAARGGKSLVGAACALVMFEQTAYGYADPGAGALMWQIFVAGLVGGLFYLRRVMTWLKRKDRHQ